MKEQTRAEPRFSLCGLNCGLCPMYHISETKLHKITNEKLHRQLRRIEDEKVELSDASVR